MTTLDTDTFQLKHTNVSQPRLSHQESQQSIAASEGYYSVTSASEGSSTGSDERGRSKQSTKFHTPPSHHRTPAHSHERLQQPQATVTYLKGVGIPRIQAQATYHSHHSPAVSTIAEERPDTKASRRSQLAAMESDSLATTPGMDQTPYIRFAIDQITRDEEVRGSRIYPKVASLGDEDYPVERLLPDEGLGYMQQEEDRRRRMSRPPQPPPQRKPVRASTQQDVFVPHTHIHAPLRFLPSILRPHWLGIYILLCVLMLGGLIFSAVFSNRNSGAGLWDYVDFGDSRFFVFEYLPTLLGGLLLLWLVQIQVAVQRIVPFMSMASDSARQRSEGPLLQLYPMQFLLPNIEHFKAKQPIIGAFFVASWLFSWTIPLLASSFNVRYYTEPGVWRWIAVQGVIWAAIALYIVLIIALIALLVVFARQQTGLKWDPRSLADVIAMLERSNVTNHYTGSETFNKHDFRERLGERADRLGHWSTTRQPNDLFHGIGEPGGATRRFSVEEGRILEKGSEDAAAQQRQDSHRPGDFSIRMDIRNQKIRLRYLPWYLRDSAVIAWIVAAIVLLVAFLVISYVNSAVRMGFLPQVSARTNAAGFSTSNFLYSFVPAVIGHILFLIVLSLDYTLRGLRPYISLSTSGGATAETSLLLDYPARLPLSVTAAALDNKHYQTAILSLVSLTSITLPILAGGCFWTQYYPDTNVVRVAADLPAYYALCFFLALYTTSFFALLPGRRRAALPHKSTTLAEMTSWLYQSPILNDRAFSRPQTKPELVARLMGNAYLERTFAQSLSSLVRPSKSNLRADSPTDPALHEHGHHHRQQHSGDRTDVEKRASVLEPGNIRYGFGIHVGRDGLEHLGIDRIVRGGGRGRGGRVMVLWEEQRGWAGDV